MLFPDSIVLISGKKKKNDAYVSVMLAVRTVKLCSSVRVLFLSGLKGSAGASGLRWVSSMQQSRDPGLHVSSDLPPSCTSSLPASSQLESPETDLTHLTSAPIPLAGPNHVTVPDYKGS